MNFNKLLIEKLRKDNLDIGYKGLDLFLFHFKKQKKIKYNNLELLQRLLDDKIFYRNLKDSFKEFKLFKNEQ